jgi:putative glutamine amidotransferase
MSKPLVGITSRNSKDADSQPTLVIQHVYLNAITQAGGIAIPIPSNLSEENLQQLYLNLNGILFSGGGDIALPLYPGLPHPRIDSVDQARDATELCLMNSAIRDGKPILGICRGAQLMNVALGGTLYTHIPDQLPHALNHDYLGSQRTVLAHEVRIEEGTRLAGMLGAPIVKVNSHHHQGLKDIAPGLRVAGHAPDGLVEAVEVPDHPFGVAVQWHPEWLTDQPAMLRLFRTFIQISEK